MPFNQVRFSIAKHAAWAPGVTSPAAWAQWADAPFPFVADEQPPVSAMPAMLRRRAGVLGKMALEVAYQCLGDAQNVPTVFVSRHGEVARAIELFADLAQDQAVSPTTFGLAVHNASAGLFSIARKDQANHIALAAGSSSVEHAVIEACGLLADGAPQVLLVAYDCPLPPVFSSYQDCAEQPHAFAWLMQAADDHPQSGPAAGQTLQLSWQAAQADIDIDVDAHAVAAVAANPQAMPASLQVLRFQLAAASANDTAANFFERIDGPRCWRWEHHV